MAYGHEVWLRYKQWEFELSEFDIMRFDCIVDTTQNSYNKQLQMD